MNKSRQRPSMHYAIGSVFAVGCILFGYGIRGSEVTNDARLRQMKDISASLREISESLPPVKTVQVETVVQAPFCEFALTEHMNKGIRDSIPDFPVKELQVCKHLMSFSSPFFKTDNTYDAIGEWVKTSKATPDGLEDEIMATVLSTLVYCFQNT